MQDGIFQQIKLPCLVGVRRKKVLPFYVCIVVFFFSLIWTKPLMWVKVAASVSLSLESCFS